MIKVASYCRVSTDREDQANSFESQQRYFRDHIRDHPDWELYRIYADEGITGTSTKRRTQFNKMMEDAYAGRFHLIITKEVSRFSRNILDTIAYTRELRAMGIGVVFANDRINTLEPEAEMMLSFLASLAQEESRRTSSRVVWGQTRQMEKGVVFGHSLLGYDVSGGVMTVNEEGAEIVRMIFQQYAQEKMSTSQIAQNLNCKGYRTYRCCGEWKPGAVIRVLRNEKYTGDLVQKKTYTPDYLTHEKRANRGEVPFVILKNHHEPIVSRELWDMAQRRLGENNRQRGGKGGHSNRYIFSGKIRCGECGSSFVGRFKYRKDGTKLRRWSCGRAVREGARSCDIGKLVRDDDAMEMLKTAIGSLSSELSCLIAEVEQLALETILEGRGGSADDTHRLEGELELLAGRKEAVMDGYFSGIITREDMEVMNRKYNSRMEELHHRKREAELRQRELGDPEALRSLLGSELSGIARGEIESEVFWKNMLESLTVFKDRHMELRLKLLPRVFRFSG